MSTRAAITPGSIKVSRPGQDATVASMKDLILAIGMNTGQILSSGTIPLNGGTVDIAGRIRDQSGSVGIGPFSTAPAALIGVRCDDGLIYVNGSYVVDYPFNGTYQQAPDIYIVAAGNITVGSNFISASLTPGATRISGLTVVTFKRLISVEFVLYRRPFY